MKQTNKRPIVLKLVAIVAILHGLLILFAYLLPGYSLLKEVFGYMKVRHSFSNECQLVMNNLTLISVALTLGASLLGLIFIILAVGIWIGKRSSWFNILALYFALYFSSLLVLKSYFNIKVNWAESGVVIFLIVAPLFIEKIKHHCNVGKLREIRN